MKDKNFELLSEQYITDNQTTKIIYDGSKESVEKIMDFVSFTSGINNTPDYLMLLGKIIPKGSVFTKDAHCFVVTFPNGKNDIFDKRDFLCLI